MAISTISSKPITYPFDVADLTNIASSMDCCSEAQQIKEENQDNDEGGGEGGGGRSPHQNRTIVIDISPRKGSLPQSFSDSDLHNLCSKMVSTVQVTANQRRKLCVNLPVLQQQHRRQSQNNNSIVNGRCQANLLLLNDSPAPDSDGVVPPFRTSSSTPPAVVHNLEIEQAPDTNGVFNGGPCGDGGGESDDAKCSSSMLDLASSPLSSSSHQVCSSDEQRPSFARTPMKVPKRKSVRFSDDLGQPLFSIHKFDSEDNLMAGFRPRTGSNDMTIPKYSWYLMFQQPAQDYLNFKTRITTNYVSLANCFITGDGLLRGTVRVKDIAYHKQVFIRLTINSWKSFFDQEAVYSDSIGFSNEKMDNFTFSCCLASLKLPKNDQSVHIEFAVCFKCANQEHWDNNFGKNYQIGRNVAASRITRKSLGPLTEDCKPNYTMFNSLTAFRSWNHFAGETSFY